MSTAFDEIVALAKDRTHAGRRRLAACFSDAFFIHAEHFSSDERSMALEIMAALLRDAELEIRKELSRRFAKEPSVPRSLVVGLAQDIIDVARPVLLHSPVLRDSDLIQVIEVRGIAHRMAIASRREIGSPVTDALAQLKEPLVAMTLLQNNSIRLPESTLRELAAQSLENAEISHCLALRPEITPELAEKLYWLVSHELRDILNKQFDLNPCVLDKTLQNVVDTLIKRDEDPEQQRDLAGRLIASGAVDAVFLIELLKNRGITLFHTLMEELTQIDHDKLQVIYKPEGLEALAIICRALHFTKTETASFIMLVRDRIAGEDRFEPEKLAAALTVFSRLTMGDAKTILWQWQMDASYLQDVASGRMN